MNNQIRPSGILDAASADALLAQIHGDLPVVVDFSDVTGIQFAALRRLMNGRRSGCRFSIVNASDAVMERFVDSGVSAYIDIGRRPRKLDMSQYVEFGESVMYKAYKSADGDAIIKVYSANVPASFVMQEQAVARAVMHFGLPTPLVGTIYVDGDKTALDFERIEGKRSFSRIIAEEPERTVEITSRFAKMCKQLHSTPCDTSIFSDRKLVHRQAVLACPGLSDGEREQILRFVDAIPDVTTCLHGDLQMSNVITTPEGEDLWIDLSEFGYGHPMLDIAMWYFLTRLNPEELVQHLFHMGLAETARVWDLFVEEYADARSPEEKLAFEQQVRPYAALHMIYLGVNVGFKPGLMDRIREILKACKMIP